MSNNNGKHKGKIIEITYDNGNINVQFLNSNQALLSYAIRVASLQLDNAIMKNEIEKAEKEAPLIEMPKGIIDKLRGK